jgi:UDP-N-acetylbacillosamine N-acetyltransferase
MNDLWQNLVIWGASGHALVVIDILIPQKNYKIVGLIDSINTEIHGTEFRGFPILGGREKLSYLKTTDTNCGFVAIGNNQARMYEGDYLRSLGFDVITVIHPQSIISPDVKIGSGTVICAGAIVVAGSQIGQDVIINTSSSVDHECVIEDGVHIGPGVHIGGRTIIKQGAWIGIGATVSDRITIGANSIIGAGAVVVRDIPPGVVAYGVPAKVIRNIDSSVQY